LRGRTRWTWIVVMAIMAVASGPALAQEPAPAPAPAPAPTPAPSNPSGGSQYDAPDWQPTVPGSVAQIVDGMAYAPADAPMQVQQAIWAANKIVGLPYRYGGGHRLGFEDTAYDCSGTVSYALHGGGLVRTPMDSTDFMRWGMRGQGQWITVWTSSGHAYMTIAGIRLDTSAAGDPSGLKGPRWRPLQRPSRGYRARHPLGL
jgi:cell wall-associated NlpC family hydrolase